MCRRAMSYSWTKPAAVAAALLLAALAGGCIADNAADADLPWATNSGWEGMTPLPSSVIHQYD